MEALQPPPKLQRLQMYGYDGTQLPVWITTSLSYLRVLRIDSFENCSSLPPLGKLPMLEELEISNMESMKYVGNELLGVMETIQELPNAGPAFQKLRKLSFYSCRDWEKWDDITGDEKDRLLIMPCLRELDIHYCDKLKALPHCLLSALEYLTVKDSSCLASLYGDRTGDEWDKISHIPHIKVDSLEDIRLNKLERQRAYEMYRKMRARISLKRSDSANCSRSLKTLKRPQVKVIKADGCENGQICGGSVLKNYFLRLVVIE
ncbi:Hypothetical predicted protein [Olea europaea subsp. europaea]|uniref:R13L1/DRL21-like LRR repeat region domain-containing protein n=1 Tax=Olea europaea subsp. europaea TaxID=158383 RepID=A0A8S0PZ56_OLEEU|nr:Hypothetical predicted protein [Olea europaea subsp. europaea]